MKDMKHTPDACNSQEVLNGVKQKINLTNSIE